MENENIVVVSSNDVELRGVSTVVKNFGHEHGGHQLVASIRSAEDIDGLVAQEIRPTVAILGGFLTPEAAEAVAKQAREAFSGIKVIAFPADSKPEWADGFFPLLTSGKKVMDGITKLQH